MLQRNRIIADSDRGGIGGYSISQAVRNLKREGEVRAMMSHKL